MEMAPSLFQRTGESQNVDEKFLAAVEIVQNMPKDGPVTATTDEKLAFYSLYKQATVGPCNTPQPAFWNVVDRYKWDAWNNLGSMDCNQAKANYINKVLRKVLLVSREHDIEEWMQSELFEKLLPKFTTLGLRPSVRTKRQQSSIEEESGELISRPETVGDPLFWALSIRGVQVDEEEHSESRTHSPFESARSYVDYEDDDEEERHSRASQGEESFDELDSSHRDRSDSVLRKYTHKIEDELRIISRQITNLATAAEDRHTSLKDVFKRAIPAVPSGISWKTIAILVIWPFIANYLFRMFRYIIGV
ncbi:hypothetical protein Aduo_008555 [Ancylostoma duodenale]